MNSPILTADFYNRSALVVARDLMDRFHCMIQRRASTDLEPWIVCARHTVRQ